MESHMMPVKISIAGCPSLLLGRVITLFFPSHGLLPPTELRKGSPGLLPVGYNISFIIIIFLVVVKVFFFSSLRRTGLAQQHLTGSEWPSLGGGYIRRDEMAPVFFFLFI